MKAIIVMLAAGLAGFLGHLVRPLLRRQFTVGDRYDGWFAIISYSVGVVMVLPFFLILFCLLIDRFMKGIGEDREEAIAILALLSWFCSFLPFGIGTLAGHWLLPDE